MIISISGASGTGKTTAIKRLTELSPRYKRLKSYTTRHKRSDDSSGEICSISDDEFENLVSSGKFLWNVNVYGNNYGSLRSELEDALSDTETILLCDVAPSAVRKIVQLFEIEGTSQHALRRVYLAAPPREELRLRLRDRDMPSIEVEKRLKDLEINDRLQIVSGNYDIIIFAHTPQNEVIAILRAISSEVTT